MIHNFVSKTGPMDIKLLKKLTFSYLLLPNLLFVATWVNTVWMITGLGCLIFALVASFKYINRSDELEEVLRNPQFSTKTLLLLAAFTLVLGYFFSLGNFGTGQSFDYFKHNTLFRELYEKPFPITYPPDGRYQLFQEDAILGYYFAYYLVPAFICKYIGVGSGNVLLYVWGAAGLYLSFLWLIMMTPKKVSIMFAGLTLLLCTTFFKPYLYAHYLVEGRFDLPLIRYFIWPSGISFSLINIHYSPQHFIVAAIGCAFFYYEVFLKKDYKLAFFFLSLLLFWSFLGAVSLAFFFVFFVLYNFRRNSLSAINILGGGYLVVLMFFYFSAHFKDSAYQGFMWTFDISDAIRNKPTLAILSLVGYMLIEIGVLVFFLLRFFSKSPNYKPYRALLLFCVALFVIAPVYRVGFNNDTAMRIISTIKIVLYLLTFYYLSKAETQEKKLVVWYLYVFILLGFVSSFTTLKWMDVPKISDSPTIDKADIPAEYYLQYFAKKDSFFGKHIMKEADEMK